MPKAEYRLAERDCVCRLCYHDLSKDESLAVFWYSRCNKGMNIILCPKCVKTLYNLIPMEDYQ